jgi:hypothetical protein
MSEKSAVNLDEVSKSFPAHSIVPKNWTATATGSGVDLAGYNSAWALIAVGQRSTGSFTPSIQHSDDNGVADAYAAIAAADLNGDTLVAIDTAPEANVLYKVGIVRSKRYVRVVMTGADTPDMDFGATIIRGHKRHI